MPINYIDFVEERLDLGHDYGAVGGRGFATEIINDGAENEQRNASRWRALGRWQLGERSLLSDAKHIDEVEYLRQFHAARKGSKQGFRYKDWTDFKVENQLIAISDGKTDTFQLKKAYTVGDKTYYRPILKPVAGTVAIYLDGGATSSYTVDVTTGILTFDPIPPDGVTITCDFEFDVPVQFEKDVISWKLDAVRLNTGESLHQLGSVFVKEMQINLELQWAHFDPIPQIIAEPLDLGIILDTDRQYIFSTRSESLGSGYKAQASNRENGRSLLKLPPRNFDREELDQILNYFYLARGRLTTLFLSLNSEVFYCRFNSDILSIKYLHKDGLYQVTNLDFYVLGDLSFIDKETYVRAFIDSSGSMNSEIPTIQNAISILHDLLEKTVYGDATTRQNYFPNAYSYNDESWVQWMSEDLRNDPLIEPNKQVYLIWLNESASIYHQPNNNDNEPTSNYLSHLSDFLATYADREIFKAIIYSVQGSLMEIIYFQNHLVSAIEGENGYSPALRDYKVSAKIDIPPGRPPEQYLKDIFTS